MLVLCRVSFYAVQDPIPGNSDAHHWDGSLHLNSTNLEFISISCRHIWRFLSLVVLDPLTLTIILAISHSPCPRTPCPLHFTLPSLIIWHPTLPLTVSHELGCSPTVVTSPTQKADHTKQMIVHTAQSLAYGKIFFFFCSSSQDHSEAGSSGVASTACHISRWFIYELRLLLSYLPELAVMLFPVHPEWDEGGKVVGDILVRVTCWSCLFASSCPGVVPSGVDSSWLQVLVNVLLTH